VLAHLAIVAGLVFIGYRHFENVWTGLAMAGLYLLLPYTAQMLGRVDHVIPAAVLVWSIASYRRPLIVGLLIGLVAGLIYYPVFLLPLWIGFYWKRGLGRFLLGVAASGTTLVVLVLMFSTNVGVILDHMKLWLEDAEGFWEAHDEVYRLPILALFSVLCVSMAIWPTQKNLGTLISCSAAVMLGVQFWSMAGMLYVNWYLPLLLMTVYRPNLDHRVAIAAVSERWFHWRRGIKQQAA
jgi:riboflavin transporter FmnP